MYETDKFKQMENRLDGLERLVLKDPHPASRVEEHEIHTDLQHGRGDYGQPMAPETEKGMGVAA